MDPFLLKFFPSVFRKKNSDKTVNQYCQYDSQTLTMFTSSLYLAALLSSLVASTVTRRFGRKLSMLFGGLLFLVGALINGFAQHVWMLIVGRILLGFGIGFANQVYFIITFQMWKLLLIINSKNHVPETWYQICWLLTSFKSLFVNDSLSIQVPRIKKISYLANKIFILFMWFFFFCSSKII